MKSASIRMASILLAALTVLPCAVSCGGTDDGDGSAVTDNVPTTKAAEDSAAVETADPDDRTQTRDSLPEGLDFDGRVFSIYCGNADLNRMYYAGPDEETGDVVDDAVYKRNLSVSERLNISLRSDGISKDWNEVASAILPLVMAGDTTYDLFMGEQAGIAQLITDNCFVNAYSLEHLDFEKPWWNNVYMDEVSIGRDSRYFLVGDFFLDILHWTRTVFFNKRLYTDYYDSPDTLYTEVLDGKWTMARMAELAKSVYVDMNNDGVTDPGDQLGYVAYSHNSSVDPFIYGTDIAYTKRDADGYLTLTMMSDDAVALAEWLCDFFHQPGSYYGFTSDAELQQAFIDGNVLFLGKSNLGSAQALRDMKEDFGILPYPKFDEEQDSYRSLVHDATMLGAVSAASANLDMAGAVLEALNAETYRSVTHVWYETALKIKYSRDDISSQMIDLIHGSATTNFIYVYNYALNGIGLLYRALVGKNNADYASAVAQNEAVAQKKLEELIEVFRENT